MFKQDSCNVAAMFATNNVAMEITAKRRILGQYLKKMREAKGYSQEGAAYKAGMDRQQWYRIENGKSGTKRETIIKMANAVDADVREALNLAGYKADENEASDSHEIYEDIEITFRDGNKIPEDKQQKLVGTFRIVARGVMAGDEEEE